MRWFVSDSPINTKEYWDERFDRDWEAKSGRDQTRYFYRLAAEMMPKWLVNGIHQEDLSVCDWGCAEGDGIDILAEALKIQNLVGVDFSPSAINKAKSHYPHRNFLAENFLEGESTASYDIIFSSNTLEHFSDPWEVMAKLTSVAKKFIVLMIPYREYERIDEHFYSFDYTNIPQTLPNNFVLVYADTVETMNNTPCYWPGEQMLLVYGHIDSLSAAQLTLGDTMNSKTKIEADLPQKKVPDIIVPVEPPKLTFIQRFKQHRRTPLAFFKQELRELKPVLLESRFHLTVSVLRRFYRLAKKIVAMTRSKTEPVRIFNRSIITCDLPMLLSSEADDVILWGVIDWHFRFQRPQQLATGFARKGHRVFYVSSTLIDSPEPGFKVESLNPENTIFQINFNVKGAPAIYYALPSPESLAQLRMGLAKFIEWTNAEHYLSIVQHPFWIQLTRDFTQSHFIYDCMDHHEGFGTTANEMIVAEHALMRECETLIVTSDWLYEVGQTYNKNIHIVRNACDFEHFSKRPSEVYQDAEGRRILGYYGAIADWFDVELVQKTAQKFSDCLILLIGEDSCGAAKQLEDCANVVFTGEVNYKQLPYYLYSFDVCMIPFKLIELTLATNPVKVYEYLCSGKPVVSVDLPEVRSLSELLFRAKNHDDFMVQIASALSESANVEKMQARIDFASQQTWTHRAEQLENVLIKKHEPLVSIIVLTYNNLQLTKNCLISILEYTHGVNYELIIVDNASTDGSREYLTAFAKNRPNVRLQLNDDNTGFAKGNNQGMALAKGDYLVVLNNDTIVTPGWLKAMVRHLEKDPSIGLIGPVSNNVGNEAKILITYNALDQIPLAATNYTRQHMGMSFEISMLAFFCVMIPRHVYEKVGGLDEQYGLGYFEDDDYCRRVQQIGLRMVCAEDAFVHHYLSASFNKLKHEQRQELFARNKAIFEKKWGKWSAHSYRPSVVGVDG
jgi:GT2 family glycosyltransferase/glycosyltransferase involved in cell wall biosynthesis